MQTLQFSRLKREKPIVVVGRHGSNLRADIARPLVQIARIAIEERALRRIPLATEALGAGQNVRFTLNQHSGSKALRPTFN